MNENFFHNGQAHGGLAQMLLKHQYDTGALRPFVGKGGRSFVELKQWNRDGSPIINTHTRKQATKVQQTNADASLRKDEWIDLETAVRSIARPELRFFSDLRRMVTPRILTGGMATILIQEQRMGDISGAQMGMSPLRKSERDLPEFDYVTTPAPLTYKHFFIDGRELLASRRRGEGLETTTGREMARKVAEEVEQRGIGAAASFSYGGGTLYGMTNYTNRNTVVLTAPTAGAWTGSTLITEVLGMVQAAQDDNFNGPYILYYGKAWTQYFGDDYSAAKGDNTLWERLEAIPDIGMGNVRKLNYLTGFQMVLVQMTADVIQPMVGMDIQTIQYPSVDPFYLEFVVICLLLTRCRSDKDGNTGIVHGNIA